MASSIGPMCFASNNAYSVNARADAGRPPEVEVGGVRGTVLGYGSRTLVDSRLGHRQKEHADGVGGGAHPAILGAANGPE